MNERLKGFLKQASDDELLREKLDALAGLSAEERVERTVAIAQGSGFDLTAEDFVSVKAKLDDDELNAVAGGNYDCACQHTGVGMIDNHTLLCECPTTGTGARTDGSGIVQVDSVCHYMGDVG